MPMTITTKKLTAASWKTNRPVSTAISANLKMIRLAASFIRLSPSMIADKLLDTLTCFKTEVADTASGGEMIPPSKKPSAMENPGIIELDTIAITNEVRITMRKAKLLITRRYFQNSFHEVFHAASYSSGGRKTIKIISGLMLKGVIPGIKLKASPPSTSTIG